MSDKRIEWIDFSKGVAIYLIIIGHCFSQGGNLILTLVYGFHVPFFFIISGYLYGKKSHMNYSFNVKNFLSKLLLPYFIFDGAFALFVSVLNHPEGLMLTFCHKLVPVIGLRGVSSAWFLPCMALVDIIFIALYKMNYIIAYVISILLFSIGIYFDVTSDMNPVLGGELVALWRCFVGIGFFATGFLIGKRKDEIKEDKRIFLALLFGAYVFLVWKNEGVNLANLEFNSGILYFLNSLLGTWLLVQVSIIFIKSEKRKDSIVSVITYLGKNSLFILGTHGFIIEIIRLIDFKIFNNLLPRLGIFEGIVFGLIICICEFACLKLYCNFKENKKVLKKFPNCSK